MTNDAQGGHKAAFDIYDHGTIVEMVPNTKNAADWVNEHVDTAFNGVAAPGRSMFVGHQYAVPIIEGYYGEFAD